MNQNRMYCDAAATTPVDPRVVQEMAPYFSEQFANPASLHTEGKQVLRAVDNAREEIAKLIDCNPQDVIFTSGATESNNLLLNSIANQQSETPPHIIISAIEHSSILKTCQELKKQGKIELTLLGVDTKGNISTTSIEQYFQPNTALVSVMFANNEIGTIQPIREIGRIVRTTNKRRVKEGLHPIVTHTDASQAWNSLECSMKHLLVDAITFSGHKIYGPKGIGILARNKSIKIRRMLSGGGQEYELRAGTLNVPGIVGMARAMCIRQQEREKYNTTLRKIQRNFCSELKKNIEDITINTPSNSLPNIVNITFHNSDGEILLYKLDKKGIAVSNGSACGAGTTAPSATLVACGKTTREAQSSIRFSFLKSAQVDDVNRLMHTLLSINNETT